MKSSTVVQMFEFSIHVRVASQHTPHISTAYTSIQKGICLKEKFQIN